MERRPTDRLAFPNAAAILGLLVLAALWLTAAPVPAAAQWGDSYDAPAADPYAAPPPRRLPPSSS